MAGGCGIAWGALLRGLLAAAALASLLAPPALAAEEGHRRPTRKPPAEEQKPPEEAPPQGPAPSLPVPLYLTFGPQEAGAPAPGAAAPRVEDFLGELDAVRLPALDGWGGCGLLDPSPGAAPRGAPCVPAEDEFRYYREARRIAWELIEVAGEAATLGDGLAAAGEWSAADALIVHTRIKAAFEYSLEATLRFSWLLEVLGGRGPEAEDYLRERALPVSPPVGQIGGTSLYDFARHGSAELTNWRDGFLPRMREAEAGAREAHERGEVGFLTLLRRRCALLDAEGRAAELAHDLDRAVAGLAMLAAEGGSPAAPPGEAPRRKERKKR